jgi:hypothetical protein
MAIDMRRGFPRGRWIGWGSHRRQRKRSATSHASMAASKGTGMFRVAIRLLVVSAAAMSLATAAAVSAPQENRSALLRRAEGITLKLTPLLSLVEVMSFGTSATSEKLRNGVLMPPGSHNEYFSNGRAVCYMFWEAALVSGTDYQYAYLEAPFEVSINGAFVIIDGAQLKAGRVSEGFMRRTHSVGNPDEFARLITPRARIILKFGLADDASKLALLLREYSTCASN